MIKGPFMELQIWSGEAAEFMFEAPPGPATAENLDKALQNRNWLVTYWGPWLIEKRIYSLVKENLGLAWTKTDFYWAEQIRQIALASNWESDTFSWNFKINLKYF